MESSSQSPVEQLPRDLFGHLCSFLSLYEKCAKLTVLNQSINQSFDPHTCCSSDKLTADLDVTFNQWMSAIRAGYCERQHILGCWTLASSVRLIEVSINQSFEPAQSFYRQQIQYEIRSALSFNRLKSLAINETLSSYSFANEIVCSIQRQPNDRLKHLSLCFYADDQSINQSINQSMYMDWSGVSSFRSLTSFCLNTGDGVSWSVPQLICSNLPDSLTSLEIQTYFDSASISDLLTCQSFLPNLEVLILRGNANLQCGAELSTIMQSTNLVRPLRALKARISSFVDFTPFSQLINLEIALYEEGLTSIFDLPNDSLPLLNSFHLTTRSFSHTIDFHELSQFLCLRPIAHLKLDVWFENDSICQIANKSVTCLSQLACLESLYVLFRTEQAHPVFIESDIDEYLPYSCWPRLTSLKLMRFPCTSSHLATLLSASPALHDFTCTSSNITVTKMLAMVTICCPKLHKIKLVSLIIPRLHEAQQDLQDVDFSTCALQSCDIVGWGLCPLTVNDVTLAHLLDKLSSAPQLYKFRESYSPSRIRAYLQHKLPHVRNVILPDHIFANERNSVAGRRCFNQSINQSIDRSINQPTQCEPPFFTLSNGDRYEFNREIDSQGHDGRQAFFRALYESLCVADRQRVRDWEDHGYNQSINQSINQLTDRV